MTDLKKSILVINAGSSSIKFQIFDIEDNLNSVAKGQVDGIGSHPVCTIEDNKTELEAGGGHTAAMSHILKWIEEQNKWKVVGAGHRFVHGGSEFSEPVKLDDEILGKLAELTPLAPLHQPHHISAVKSLKEVSPDLPQVSCFDTAFHAGQDRLNKTFALPKKYFYEGVKRYGFHGLSYEFIAHKLKEDHPELAKGKVIVCHLGNGASVCGIDNGKSIDGSTGMSIVEGLPMGTRTGCIDPGAVLHIMEHENKSIAEINHLLSKESGLLGLSCLTNDMRELREAEADGNEDAAFAIKYFVFKIAQFVASLSVSVGGIDGLVFTGGIGEKSEETRNEVMEMLSFLPKFETLVIPTNEEMMIAKSTQKVLGL